MDREEGNDVSLDSRPDRVFIMTVTLREGSDEWWESIPTKVDVCDAVRDALYESGLINATVQITGEFSPASRLQRKRRQS